MPRGNYNFCTYDGTATRCIVTFTSPLTQVMMPEKTGPRKSKRASAVTWKEGDTRALFRVPGHRAPEEIAASRKKAAEERKSKEQAMEAKAKNAARDIRHAAQVEDALAKKREEMGDAFPRRRGGMFN